MSSQERQAMKSVLEAQIQQKEMDRENIRREPLRSDDQYRKVAPPKKERTSKEKRE